MTTVAPSAPATTEFSGYAAAFASGVERDSRGDWAGALDAFREAERLAAGPDEAGEALRRQVILHVKIGDRRGQIAAFRRLRKRDRLKINEHRRLVQALRAAGQHGLVTRYVALLRTSVPTSVNSTRVALVLWAAGALSDLFAWTERHPGGPGGAFSTLLTLAMNSAEHHEYETAVAILTRLQKLSAEDPDRLLQIGEVFLQADEPAAAFEVAESVLAQAPERDEATGLLARAGRAELEQRAVELGAGVAEATLLALERIERALGVSPQSERLRAAAEAWIGTVDASLEATRPDDAPPRRIGRRLEFPRCVQRGSRHAPSRDTGGRRQPPRDPQWRSRHAPSRDAGRRRQPPRDPQWRSRHALSRYTGGRREPPRDPQWGSRHALSRYAGRRREPPRDPQWGSRHAPSRYAGRRREPPRDPQWGSRHAPSRYAGRRSPPPRGVPARRAGDKQPARDAGPRPARAGARHAGQRLGGGRRPARRGHARRGAAGERPGRPLAAGDRLPGAAVPSARA
jgi:tetratricopeptide (TPR) repeat protein